MTSDNILESHMDDKRYEAMGEHTAEPINDRASGTAYSPKPRPKEIIKRILAPYNAQIVKEDGNTFYIQYPKLGQGSCIASDLEQVFTELRTRITPSDLLLEVEIL